MHGNERGYRAQKQHNACKGGNNRQGFYKDHPIAVGKNGNANEILPVEISTIIDHILPERGTRTHAVAALSANDRVDYFRSVGVIFLGIFGMTVGYNIALRVHKRNSCAVQPFRIVFCTVCVQRICALVEFVHIHIEILKAVVDREIVIARRR